jgi:hypothetical protein
MSSVVLTISATAKGSPARSERTGSRRLMRGASHGIYASEIEAGRASAGGLGLAFQEPAKRARAVPYRTEPAVPTGSLVAGPRRPSKTLTCSRRPCCGRGRGAIPASFHGNCDSVLEPNVDSEGDGTE